MCHVYTADIIKCLVSVSMCVLLYFLTSFVCIIALFQVIRARRASSNETVVPPLPITSVTS
jgi:hypothetical protein